MIKVPSNVELKANEMFANYLNQMKERGFEVTPQSNKEAILFHPQSGQSPATMFYVLEKENLASGVEYSMYLSADQNNKIQRQFMAKIKDGE